MKDHLETKHIFFPGNHTFGKGALKIWNNATL